LPAHLPVFLLCKKCLLFDLRTLTFIYIDKSTDVLMGLNLIFNR
jgi:hypothetical protein